MSIRIGKKIISGNEKGKLSIPLLTPVFFDYELNDISWLRSDTFSWHSGDTYSEVYNHLLSDMSSGYKEIENYESSNVVLVGNVFDNDGVLSGFYGKTSYATFKVQKPTSSFELVIKVHVPATITHNMDIVHPLANYNGVIIRLWTDATIRMWLSSNGTSWDVINNYNPTLTVPKDADVWFKLSYNGANYVLSYSTDNKTWTAGAAVTNSNVVYWDSGTHCLGGSSTEEYPYDLIYLDGSYLKVDGNIVWHGINTWKSFQALDGHEIVFPGNEEQVQKEYLKNGSAWYYILDTAKKRFKLPRGRNTRIVKSYKSDSRWYRLYADGWVEQGGLFDTPNNTAGVENNVVLPLPMANDKYTATIGIHNTTNDTGMYLFVASKTTTAITFKSNISSASLADQNWQVSGYADVDSTQAGDKYLYFYVGLFSKTAIEQTAGITSEQLNNKVDIGHQVIAFQAPTAENNYTWCRKYADGWVEQGGVEVLTGVKEKQITFPVVMRDNNYTPSVTAAWSSSASGQLEGCDNLQTTGMRLTASYVGITLWWQVNGIAA
jgi:hypothetical protein